MPIYEQIAKLLSKSVKNAEEKEIFEFSIGEGCILILNMKRISVQIFLTGTPRRQYTGQLDCW